MNRLLGLVGLCRRAGRLALGDACAGESARAGRARALLLAQDAGDTARRRAVRWAEEADVPLLTLPVDKAALGRALGRASCAVAAVEDTGFARQIEGRLTQFQQISGGGFHGN